jgi:hypothetical protein
MTKNERELTIQILVNIDDITKLLTKEQRKQAEPCIKKIYGNYWNLLEGVR